MGGLLLYTQARWVWKTSNVQCFLRRNWKLRHVWNELFYFILLAYLSDTEITHSYLSDCSPPISLIHLQTYTHSFSLSFPLLNLTSNWTQFWPYTSIVFCFNCWAQSYTLSCCSHCLHIEIVSFELPQLCRTLN